MKISNLKLQTNVYQNKTPETKPQRQTVSFGAGEINPMVNIVVNTMDAIQRGGLFASFTIQDNLGINIPRTIAGLNRNSNKTGKLNYKAAAEEAIREYTTGPSMFLIPALVFWPTKKFFGKSTNIDFDLLNFFNDKAKQINIKNISNKQDAKQDFFKNIIRSITKDEAVVDSITARMTEIDKLKVTDFATKKEYKHQIGKLQEEIAETFAKLNKQNPKLAIAPSMIEIQTGKEIISKNSSAFINKAKIYSDDVLEKTLDFISNTKQNITQEKFAEIIKKQTRTVKGAKLISSIIAAGCVFSFMTIIPKLYSINKTYPGKEGLEPAPTEQEEAANASK